MLKVEEIKAMDDKAIKAKTIALRVEIFEQKMQKGISEIEKPHKIKDAKKDIARLLTVLNSRKNR